MRIQPVILCGGAGTRLWPLSREAFPKQFLGLGDERSLLQRTAQRLDGVEVLANGLDVAVAQPLIVCNENHRFLVQEQLAGGACASPGILLEPVGRNTAPALTAAALNALAGGDDPVLLVMPADHIIPDTRAFQEAVVRGAAQAAEGRVVTFGIVPQGPETGYGYIRRGAQLADGVFALDAFVEKPDVKTAQSYVDSGEFLWNSGIFMMRASVWMDEIHRHRPDIEAACRDAVAAARRDGCFIRLDKAAFAAGPADSIDYAVMEKLAGPHGAISHRPAVVALDAGWSDVGAWPALWQMRTPDEHGNVRIGDAIAIDSRGSLLMAENRLIAAVGVEDLVVVETADAVLVASKDKAQQVKDIARHLKEGGRQEHEFHRRVHRPWGSYEGVDAGARFQVKRLTVKPGAALSLQMHHHRAEHWVVVSGTARVTRGDEVFLLSENQSTYIPLGTTHRLENPGTIPLEIIEVQSGSYLGEDDIVRFEDVYNRNNEGC